jgi:predicted nucleic acid-binding protein
LIGSASFTAFYDANVLYSAALRDLLMVLTNTGLFRVKWSRAVQEEWISNLLKNRPDLTREKLERTRLLMDKHAIDAVVTGYEHLIPSVNLPDPNDRHVVAAAIHGRADVIVTMNLKDFPAGVLAPLNLQAQHPDEFVLHLVDLAPGAVIRATEEHRGSLKNPPKTLEDYLDTLESQGLTQTSSVLREYMLA